MTLDAEAVAYAGVTGQLELLRSGRLSAVDLLHLCLARLDRFDGRLNAFRTDFFERALAEARTADEARAAGQERPVLGVPVAVKDNVLVAGRAAATGTGSPEPVAAADAEQVRRLRAAGMVAAATASDGEGDVVPVGVDVLVLPVTGTPPRAIGSLPGLAAQVQAATGFTDRRPAL